MFNILKQVVKDSATGIDGISYDVMKLFAIIGFFVGIGLEIYDVVGRGKAFDMLTFATGLGALFIALAGALKLKESTEPAAPSSASVVTTTDISTTTVSKG